jgi:serine/threonine-protein kinase
MGEVYAADDERLGRSVALKLVPPNLAGDAEALARFQREARAAATIAHSNIVTVHSIEEDQGVHFLTMELVDGQTLAEHVQAGGLALGRVLDLGIQIADGVAAAHDHGIIHRDLKPANVMVTRDGRVKVLDFGLAKLREAYVAGQVVATTDLATDLTGKHQVVGTFAYMSPEQAEGKPIDHRTDIFALGIVLYELATGERPFKGDSPVSVLSAIIRDNPQPITAIAAAQPRELWRIVKRALAKDPDRRYQNAKDLRNELLDVKHELEVGELHTGHLAVPQAQRPGRMASAYAAGVLAVGAAAYAMYAFTGAAGSSAVAGGGALRPQVMRFRLEQAAAIPRPIFGNTIAISPDGTKVAFNVSTETGFFGVLHIRDLRTGLSRVVGDGSLPFFSSDSGRLVFLIPSDGRYAVASVEGGSSTPLTERLPAAISRGTWGSGEAIIFEDSGTLFAQSPASKPTILARPDVSKSEVFYYSPSLVPGHKAIVFSVIESNTATFDEASIVVRDLETGAQKVLLKGGMSPRVLAAGFLTFARAGVLYAAPFSLDRLEVTGNPVPVQPDILTEPLDGIAPYDISDNGTLVYISGRPRTPAHRVVVYDRKGRAEPLNLEPRAYRRIRMAPSGNALALEVYGATVQTWILDFKRNVLERVTQQWSNEGVEWSPDESHLAHYSTRGGRSGIYLSALRTAEPDILLHAADQLLSDTAYAPDGRSLVLADAYDLWVVSTDGSGTKQPIVSTPFLEQGPALSQDGRWLAFRSNEAGREEIFVTAFPGGGRRFRVARMAAGGVPRWTRQGREICFVADDRRSIKCAEVSGDRDFSASEPKTMLTHQELILRFDITPNGDRFYVLEEDNDARRSGAPVEVVVNWFEELNAKMAQSATR